MLKLLKQIYKSCLSERSRIQLHYFKHYIRGFFYSGTQVECVCCKKKFSKFLTYGNIRRKNAACPSCNSLERNRILFLYLKENTNFFRADLSVLHFAPEYKLEKIFRKQDNLDYISADINPELAMKKIDIQDIEFEDNHFDFILCSHVLGHVPDELTAFKELKRVLKPNGSLILMTKIYDDLEYTFEALGMKNAENQDIFRKHGRDFADRIRESGFEVTVKDLAKELGPEKTMKYGLGQNELLFICHELV
jgi:SAM-dependent methyltransferase